jgi:hypothetical protein
LQKLRSGVGIVFLRFYGLIIVGFPGAFDGFHKFERHFFVILEVLLLHVKRFTDQIDFIGCDTFHDEFGV